MASLPLGLLRFCIEHSDDPVGMVHGEKKLPDRDPADYKWLMEALDNLEDDAAKARKLLATLKNPASTEEEKKFALEGIQYYVEDIDVAKDLEKSKGLESIVELISHTNPDLRYWSAWVLASSTQNNPSIQEYALRLNALPLLLKVLAHETNEKAHVRQLSALSALLSDHPKAQETFRELMGVETLTPWTRSTNEAIKMRSNWILDKVRQTRT